MAYVSKRGKSWRCEVSLQGVRDSTTFDTKREAELWGMQREAIILEGKPATVQKDLNNTSLIDIFKKYKKEVSVKKRGAKWEVTRLSRFEKEPMFFISINNVNNVLIASWRDKRLTEVSAATVRRELTLLSGVFTKGIKEWGLDFVRNPVHLIQKPSLTKARSRRITQDEIDQIVDYFKWDRKTEPKKTSHWIAFAFLLAIETAMRRGELLSFTWENFHLDKSYIHLDLTKNGDERDVPLSSKAKALLSILSNKDPQARVIPIDPDVLTSSFLKMRKVLNINDLHFHDTRREATTRLAEKLPSVVELAAATGHKTINILYKTYYQVKAEDLAKKLG